MDIDDQQMSEFRAAGSAALEFNSPLGSGRAQQLIAELSSSEASSFVDLGCGRGELAIRVAAANPSVTVTGIDSDAGAIEAARLSAIDRGVSDRVRFDVGDLTSWFESVDSVACLGADHAYTDHTAMFERLRKITRLVAVVGIGVWETRPDEWCLETFGELSTLDALTAGAEEAGFTVRSAELSSLDEWDEFEGGWSDGVASIGSEAALEFATMRREEYLRYRGVLGFAWLVLG